MTAAEPRPWLPPVLENEPLAPAEVVVGLVRAAIERDGEARWHATGRSMAGSVRHGTTLRLVSPQRRPPRRGDVVMAVLPDGRLVVHRVRAASAEALHLRGDACRRPDPPVEPAAVVAVVDPRPPRNWRSLIRRYLP